MSQLKESILFWQKNKSKRLSQVGIMRPCSHYEGSRADDIYKMGTTAPARDAESPGLLGLPGQVKHAEVEASGSLQEKASH